MTAFRSSFFRARQRIKARLLTEAFFDAITAGASTPEDVKAAMLAAHVLKPTPIVITPPTDPETPVFPEGIVVFKGNAMPTGPMGWFNGANRAPIEAYFLTKLVASGEDPAESESNIAANWATFSGLPPAMDDNFRSTLALVLVEAPSWPYTSGDLAEATAYLPSATHDQLVNAYYTYAVITAQSEVASPPSWTTYLPQSGVAVFNFATRDTFGTAFLDKNETLGGVARTDSQTILDGNAGNVTAIITADALDALRPQLAQIVLQPGAFGLDDTEIAAATAYLETATLEECQTLFYLYQIDNQIKNIQPAPPVVTVPEATIWRIVFQDTQTGRNQRAAMSEFRFLDADGNPLPMDGATLSGTLGVDLTTEALFDGNGATDWTSQPTIEDNDGVHVTVTFPNPVTVHGFRIQASDTQHMICPTKYDLKYLNDSYEYVQYWHMEAESYFAFGTYQDFIKTIYNS